MSATATAPPIQPRRTASSTATMLPRRSSMSPSTSISPRPRRASTAATITTRPRRRDSTSSAAMTGASGGLGRGERDESEWDDGTADLGDIDEEQEGDEWHRDTRGEAEVGVRRKRRKDEPMSPVAVVFYVTALYLVFQILTRSDEHEILSHLNISPSSLASTFRSDLSAPQGQHAYHLPYHLPHLPSPLSSAGAALAGAGAGSVAGSTWRTVLSVAMYPLYAVIALLAIPLPLLSNLVRLLWSVISTLLYPFTSTARLLTRTLLLAPLGVLAAVVRALYPVWVFIGGTVSVGCVLGLSASWAGRAVLDWALGRKRKDKSSSSSRRVRRARSSRGAKSDSHSTSKSGSLAAESLAGPGPSGPGTHEPGTHGLGGKGAEKQRPWPSKRALSPSSGDEPLLHTPVAVVHPARFPPPSGGRKRTVTVAEADDEMDEQGHGVEAVGTGREPVALALGTRRRGHILEGHD